MDRAAAFLDAAYRTPMPRLPHVGLRAKDCRSRNSRWTLRRLGGKDMFRVIRALSMSTVEFTEEWFESEAAEGRDRRGRHPRLDARVDVGGHRLHADAQLAQSRRARASRGAAARAASRDALVAALKAQRRRTAHVGAACSRSSSNAQRATGVRLDERRRDPRSDGVLRRRSAPHAARPGRRAGTAAGVRLARAVDQDARLAWPRCTLRTDGSHGLPAGTLAIAPTLKYLERAYDAAKYGEIAQRPYLEVTTAGDVVSIHFQFAPYKLRGADWADARADVERIADRHACRALPGIRRRRSARSRTITPLDLERDYGPDRGRPQPRPADPRPDVLHAPAAGLVESPHADRRPVPVRQRHAWRRGHQRRAGSQCGAGVAQGVSREPLRRVQKRMPVAFDQPCSAECLLSKRTSRDRRGRSSGAQTRPNCCCARVSRATPSRNPRRREMTARHVPGFGTSIRMAASCSGA